MTIKKYKGGINLAIDTTTTVQDVIKQRAQEVLASYPQLDAQRFNDAVEDYLESRPNLSLREASDQAILRALDELDIEDGRPNWTYVANALFVEQLYTEAAETRRYDVKELYGSLYTLIQKLVEESIYHTNILEDYTEEEINTLQGLIVPERDKAFTYIGLRTLADRYMAKSKNKFTCELPQERFMLIAMALMRLEDKAQRLALVQEAYEVLSKRYMAVATPTLSNAGKSYGQFSSCFIDTVADDLRCIYDSNSDIADLSKNGGGIGLYLGHIRSRGSDIKGFPGVSQGVLPWMKQLNNTAVAVDQLGLRQGAICVYLDTWHKDIFTFLDAKLNNGDERKRTHDLFMGVTIPDIFMETVEDRGDWYIFDPHTIRKVLGFSLEDSYDEEEGKGSFRNNYAKVVEAAESGLLGEKGLLWDCVPAIDIMKRIMISQLETGSPFMFYRDEVNRKNANKHKGMIYCSNLCTEITQNQSPTVTEEVRTEDGKIIITKIPGDFVVCNLSSINLGEVYKRERENFFPALRALIRIQVRMLDNVIDLNNIPVPQAQTTNNNYRAVGLGTFGWHHLLALNGIMWDSEEAVEYADTVYEFIAHASIEASMELAKEKGTYPYFAGSEFETGKYFERREYIGENAQESDLDWDGLAAEVAVNGVRNAYIMAVAPNASTSIIAGSTASIDPIFRKMYAEEKRDYKIPVTAPDLSPATTWFYQSAYLVDQLQSIKQNSRRQRHIDQAVSFNFYVPNDIRAAELLNLHLQAWKAKFKTTYYVRSTSQAVIDDCESCHS
ncbi:ribonucleoside-diphosphate reductase subunit alpha [Priestia sp. YIM B13551]|uniref:ribonucleoside-diphosphate reductase subunit alpha n=1 Tax=Priestia sp. YIM B13551 TaxID=3366306 RepID=UPI00366E68A9